jgi:hypothetical protein
MPRRMPEQLDNLAAVVYESNTSHRGLALKYARLLQRFEASEAARAWAVDKLEKWEKLLVDAQRLKLRVQDYDVATCREIRHALDETNPRLSASPATREEVR